MVKYLVVGGGFAGAVYARSLAEAGGLVQLIDQRDHVGGNAYDFVDGNGIRRHRYGPHLFHTRNEDVVRWLSRFTEWIRYEHRVRAVLPSGKTTPLPINRQTINDVFNTSLASQEEVRFFLRGQCEQIASPANAAEYLYANIGKTLTELFFRPYTKKMWNLDLEDLADSVVRRIPLRFDDEDRYFPDDTFQMMPKHGYTAIFEKILDHPNIEVALSTTFDRSMEKQFEHIFNSMAIDEYFDCCFGPLPYRSIRFHSQSLASSSGVDPQVSVLNYTDSGPITRETYWHLLPGHVIQMTGNITKTQEEPCDYVDNDMERYYPVKTADNRYQSLYQLYKQRAQEITNVSFIGRCGTYQYLDMDQVINQALRGVKRFCSPT